METLIAEKKISQEVSRERVWDLLGTLIFDSLSSMQKLEIMDENNFGAELTAKAFGIPLAMHLRGEMVDIAPPEALTVKLAARSKWNLITVVQKITFTISPTEKGNTTMVCRSVAQDLPFLVRLFLLGQVRAMAGQIFDSIQERLKQLA